MRRPLLVLCFVLVWASLLGCGSSEPPAGAAAATCTPAYDITSTPGTRFEDVADADVVPWPIPGVTFVTTVTRVGDAAHLEGVLTNATDAEVSVDFLTGGAMGLSTNPFQVEVQGESVVAGGPESYPAPRRAVMPPHGTVTYRVDRCPPSFPAHVHWTFSPFRGTAVQGELTL